jgi:hypothetical protein
MILVAQANAGRVHILNKIFHKLNFHRTSI